MTSGLGKDSFQFSQTSRAPTNSPKPKTSTNVTEISRPTSEFDHIKPFLTNPALQQLFAQQGPQNDPPPLQKLFGASKKKKGSVPTGKAAQAIPVENTGIWYFEKQVIGSGATSRIYRGYHNTPDKPAAIKSIVSNDQSKITVYKDELDTWLTVTGTLSKENINIVQLFDFVPWKEEGSLTNTHYYFAMELATCDLGKRIEDLQDKSKETYQKLTGYLEDAANGLRWLHKQKIIHRDIKPLNILIFTSDSGEIAKLADFGISRALTNSSLGTDSAGKGTSDWMAPEAITAMVNRKTFTNTKSMDIFSLGVTAHFAMSLGDHPFEIVGGFTLMNIMQSQTLPKSLPDDKLLSANYLFQWMMRKISSERPTISQVLNHCYFYPEIKCLQFIADFAMSVANKKSAPEKYVREEVDRAFTQFYLSHKNTRNFDWGIILGDTVMDWITVKKSTGESLAHTYDTKKISSLMTLMRDKLVHFNDIVDDLAKSEQYFGEKGKEEGVWQFSEKKYAAYFLEKFPELVPVLWTTLATSFNESSIWDEIINSVKVKYKLNEFQDMYIFYPDLNS